MSVPNLGRCGRMHRSPFYSSCSSVSGELIIVMMMFMMMMMMMCVCVGVHTRIYTFVHSCVHLCVQTCMRPIDFLHQRLRFSSYEPSVELPDIHVLHCWPIPQDANSQDLRCTSSNFDLPTPTFPCTVKKQNKN